MTSHKVVTPVPGFRRDRVTGVQVFSKSMNKLDSGACPGPDPPAKVLYGGQVRDSPE